MNRKSPQNKGKRSNQKTSRRRQPGNAMHQLDVRMKSKAESRLRMMALIRWTAKTALAAAAVMGLVWSGKWIYREAFYENPDFVLSDLKVETNGVLTYQRILEEAAVSEGMNLLNVDLAAVRDRLNQLPLVEKVEVTRQLPNQMAIRIQERVAVAWLECPPLGIRSRTSNRGFLLDPYGMVLPCEALLRRYLSLPVVDARGLSRVKPGAQIESEQVLAALDLIGRSNEMFFERQLEVVEVELNNQFSMRVFYNNDAEVVFGMQAIGEQLEDLRVILDHSEARRRQIATLNLMARKNIPITYFNFSSEGLKLPAQGAYELAPPQETTITSGQEAEQRLEAIRAILGRG